MADAKLSVEIAAKLDNLSDGLKQAINKVQGFDRDATKSLKNIDKEIQSLANSFDGSGKKISTVTAKLASDAAKSSAILGGSVKKGSDQAAFALTNLGRVAQDAPFGFVGIQNNLNPLLESFARLKAETGSAGGALKALGSSLIGPAGLGIALSVVSAGILLYQEYQRKANKATEDAKKTTEDYAKTLSAVNQASLVGSQNIQGDIIKLQSLYAITQDTTVSLKQRKEAVDELQKQYPAYFKNVKDEAFLAGGAKDAYDRLTVAIIATGKARAAEQLISENSKKLLENEQKLIDIRARRLIIDKELSATNKQKLTGGSEESLQGELATIDAKRNRLQDERNEGIEIANKLSGESYKINQKNLQLTKSIIEDVKKGADLAGGVGDDDKPKAEKRTKDLVSDIGTSITKVDEVFKKTSFTISDSLNLIGKGAKKASVAIANLTADSFMRDFGKSPLELQLEGIGQAIENQKILYNQGLTDLASFQDNYAALIKEGKIVSALLDLQTGIRSIAENGIGDALSGIGTSIGEALASGENVLATVGNSVIQTFGSFLGQLGDLLIKYGIAAQVKAALDKAITIPGAGIIAGAAAIAAGIALKGIAGAFANIGKGNSSDPTSSPQRRRIPGFANGTNFAPGGLALIGERGPEIMQVPKGASITPNHNLKGLGGSTNINLAGKLRVGMRELIFEIDKERSLQRRSG